MHKPGRSVSREKAEEILRSSGIDPELESVEAALQGSTQPDGSIAVPHQKDNILSKVRAPCLHCPPLPAAAVVLIGGDCHVEVVSRDYLCVVVCRVGISFDMSFITSWWLRVLFG